MTRLDEDHCRWRFGMARRAVLSTVSPARGVDAVPTVFALDDDTIWTPVDTVKPKSSTRLTRLVNVAHDPRVCLLVDGWDDDWARLWWVRAHGRAREAGADELADARRRLAGRYEQYRDGGSIVAALVVDVDGWTGWAARG